MGWGQMSKAMRNEGSGSSLTQWSWAGIITLSVSRPTPNRKSSKIRPASRVLLNFLLGTDGYCSMVGLSFSPDFLILIITTELSQSTVQSRKIKSHTKQRTVLQLTEEYTYSFQRECG